MINGIIKLFYSEVVKSKMKNMPNEEYYIRDEFKEVSDIATKVDKIFIMIFRFIIMLTIIFISLSINLLLGIGVILTLIVFNLYKLHIENKIKDQLKEGVGYLKNNLEKSKQSIVTDKIKQKINALITLLLIGVFSNFDYIIVCCFILVFIFTIKDIYSNINK